MYDVTTLRHSVQHSNIYQTNWTLDENHGEKVEKSRHTVKKNRKIHGEFTVGPNDSIIRLMRSFLQRVSIACYAERYISYSKSVGPSVCPSDRLSVTRWHCVKTTQATIMGSSL